MADTYAPIGELDGSPNLLTVSYAVSGLLDDWHRQPHLPVATNALGRWLMDRAGYTPPPGPKTVWPPESGRGYPRGDL